MYTELQKVIRGKDSTAATGKIVGSVHEYMIKQLHTISSSNELNEMFQAITEEIYPQIQDFCKILQKDGIVSYYTGQTICDATE